MAQLDYINSITLNSETPEIVGNNTASIEVSAEIKLFTEKYSHGENEEITKGDDLGFTIVFGNYGELPWTQPTPNIATLEDNMEIAAPIRLKVMSLSLPCDYQIWVVARNGVDLTNPRQLNVCDVLDSGNYTIQLRKLVNGEYTEFFDVPCHFVECISMLMQVEFDSCPPCGGECTSVPVMNGSFEALPHNTNGVITNWSVDVPQTGNAFARTNGPITLNGQNYQPVDGSYFALLKTNGPGDATSISQVIEVCPGDTVQGQAFFNTPEVEGRFNDYAKIEILDEEGNVVATPYYRDAVNDGITNWEEWSYTFTEGGVYTIVASVTNVGRASMDSYIGVDKVEIV